MTANIPKSKADGSCVVKENRRIVRSFPIPDWMVSGKNEEAFGSEAIVAWGA